MVRKIHFLFFLLILSCSQVQNDSYLKVLEVIDGDTVKLSNGKLLRYIGIDTPEVNIKKDNRFQYSPQPYSLEAKEYNRHLVEGKVVKVEFDLNKYDKYGRLLGYCFVEDIFVNAKLIEEGYAVLYTYPPNVKYADLFVNLQNQARDKKKGLWASYSLIEASEAHLYINQIRRVRGKVLSTYESDKCVYLNFGRDYKSDFTVVIFKNSLSAFQSININPVDSYRGKTVEVTGRIKEYNGPEIIVNSPYEIEVVSDYE
ncbi:MAG: thermonuclease family protein [Candidatus Omnitrophica bacterium]|nr:thermonuclease family protein [Candidatus Omnitrophota bacterium]